jgi:hypothetical protein
MILKTGWIDLRTKALNVRQWKTPLPYPLRSDGTSSCMVTMASFLGEVHPIQVDCSKVTRAGRLVETSGFDLVILAAGHTALNGTAI